MAPLPPIASTLRAQLIWTLGADIDATTTMYFTYSGSAPDGTDADNLATAFVNAFGAADGQWVPFTILSGARVTDLTSDTAAQGTATADFAGTKTGGGNANAGALSLVANFQISRRYRGGKPRIYLPWGNSADIATAQTWSTTFLESAASDFSTAMSTWLGTTEGSTTIASHVNVSYYSGFTVVTQPGKRAKNVPTLRTTPVVNTVTGFSMLGRPGSQRRRNKG